MAIIRGTKWADDPLLGTLGNDKIFAGDGDDNVFSLDGVDIIRAGRGNDLVQFDTGKAFGGLGDDRLGASNLVFDGGQQVHTDPAYLVGGWGNDRLSGKGFMYGDGGPKDGPLITGDDVFHASLGSTMTGGAGSDTFNSYMYLPGYEKVSEITDFQSGVDRVGITLIYATGVPELTSAQIWGVLDTNGNGVLGGGDIPLDGNSQTYADGVNNTLTIRLHDDFLVIHGTTAVWADD